MKQTLTFIVLLLTSFMTNAEDAPIKKLPPCQNTPNCVSTQAVDKPHYTEPFRISGNPQKAWEDLRRAIMSQDRVMITHETDNSLHAEATSLVLHFVDDIDVVLDAEAGVIHIRSASRIGHSDFGVNRKRIETIRAHLRKNHALVS
jgi:uncharacterized protein (DUF1499 family)